MTTHLEREIAEQPAKIEALIRDGLGAARDVAARIRGHGPRFVVIAARGTSDNAARYAKYLFGLRQGWVTALATPSLHTLYGAAPDLRDALTIGISQSGRSPDVVSVIEAGRGQGGLTLAITNDPSSTLGKAAETVLEQRAGPELSVAATKTYTTQLATLAMLSACLSDDGGAIDELRRMPERMAATVDAAASLGDHVERYLEGPGYFTVGRGFNYSTAFEIALKVKETNYVIAEPYSPADLLHGPVAVVEAGFPVLAVAPRGRVAANMDELIAKLRERGARLLIVADDADRLAQADVPMRLPTGVPEWLSPLISVIPGQVWAQKLAVARGFDPDRPRGLNKVTLTL
ncbi:SIS domain protein [Plesiocystis pacifica SIR-1]|uniref:SIS domain protein n=1 Tax=Plesiocystis pacifica SIR-1 TaxID=391625 RepID=A6FX49_9BACT|nr:SIS domain-containing protein [Plesiocystis pacifica]EDM81873.1 SIS domain protein [Plesiocystis pacifica SIR-1]